MNSNAASAASRKEACVNIIQSRVRGSGSIKHGGGTIAVSGRSTHATPAGSFIRRSQIEHQPSSGNEHARRLRLVNSGEHVGFMCVIMTRRAVKSFTAAE